MTTTVRDIPTEVSLGEREGVKAGSVANLDNAHLLPVDRLLSRAESIAAERWVEFCRAMAKVMSC